MSASSHSASTSSRRALCSSSQRVLPAWCSLRAASRAASEKGIGRGMQEVDVQEQE